MDENILKKLETAACSNAFDALESMADNMPDILMPDMQALFSHIKIIC